MVPERPPTLIGNVVDETVDAIKAGDLDMLRQLALRSTRLVRVNALIKAFNFGTVEVIRTVADAWPEPLPAGHEFRLAAMHGRTDAWHLFDANGRDPVRDLVCVGAGFREKPALMLDWWLTVEAEIPKDDPLRRTEMYLGPENQALPSINSLALGQLIVEGRTEHVHRFWTGSVRDSVQVARCVRSESVASWVIDNLPLVRSPNRGEDAPCILLDFCFARGLDSQADRLRARYPLTEKFVARTAFENRRLDVLETVQDGEVVLQAYHDGNLAPSAADPDQFFARSVDLLLSKGCTSVQIRDDAIQRFCWPLVQELLRRFPALRHENQPEGYFRFIGDLEPYIDLELYADGRKLAELIESVWTAYAGGRPWYMRRKFRDFADNHGIFIGVPDPCICNLRTLPEALAEDRNIDFLGGAWTALDYEDYCSHFYAEELIPLIPYSAQIWVDELKRLGYSNRWFAFSPMFEHDEICIDAKDLLERAQQSVDRVDDFLLLCHHQLSSELQKAAT
ncbi:hypothetical protein HKX48_002226 [Thoreauomyces humboldtii]|nr:hypothetical protein HKX48_002226 [Thoreauomyces humboldtii]